MSMLDDRYLHPSKPNLKFLVPRSAWLVNKRYNTKDMQFNLSNGVQSSLRHAGQRGWLYYRPLLLILTSKWFACSGTRRHSTGRSWQGKPTGYILRREHTLLASLIFACFQRERDRFILTPNAQGDVMDVYTSSRSSETITKELPRGSVWVHTFCRHFYSTCIFLGTNAENCKSFSLVHWKK